MKNKALFMALLLVICLVAVVNVFAHPGRTDANGGHWNHSTGEYHYHTGEYAGQSTSNSNSNSSYTIKELFAKYKEGYNKGHDDGYNEGYDKGYKVGYNEGIEKKSNTSAVALTIVAAILGLPLLYMIVVLVVEFFKFLYNKLFKKD